MSSAELALSCLLLPDEMAQEKPIKAVIFDNGGTLTNMDKLRVGSITYACHSVGIATPPDEILLVMARQNTPASYQTLGAYLGAAGFDLAPKTLEQLIDADREFQIKGITKFLVEPMPDAQIALEQIQDWGIKIAVCTTQPAIMSLKTLECTDLAPFIEVNVSGDEVTNRKPEPEGIEEALHRLGDILPEEAVVIGDSEDDVIAGWRAGVRKLILISNLTPYPQILTKGDMAFAIVEDLDQALYIIHTWIEEYNENLRSVLNQN